MQSFAFGSILQGEKSTNSPQRLLRTMWLLRGNSCKPVSDTDSFSSEEPTLEAVKVLCPPPDQAVASSCRTTSVSQFWWHQDYQVGLGLPGVSLLLCTVKINNNFPKLPSAEARTGKCSSQSLGCAMVCFKKGLNVLQTGKIAARCKCISLLQLLYCCHSK